jgi:PPK2 family polyphosphate:nucleotide phosphotransferase
MPNYSDVLERLLVEPGKPARLHARDTAWKGGPRFQHLAKKEAKEKAREILDRLKAELAEAQNLLWASDTYSVLVVLQALDAAGKDGTIKHVMSGVNPQGCEVASFKQPSSEELDHDFLWRCAKRVPERGRIGIFNRSYYEEVLVVRVHPELLEYQKLPPDTPSGKHLWKSRFEQINAFEEHLDRCGTRIVKLFLHLSKDEQKERFLARLDDPEKQWKFSRADLAERGHWDEYMAAYEDALTATSTPWAPWYVIPADHKYVARTLVAAILVQTIQGLDLAYPQLDAEQIEALEEARRHLQAEGAGDEGQGGA